MHIHNNIQASARRNLRKSAMAKNGFHLCFLGPYNKGIFSFAGHFKMHRYWKLKHTNVEKWSAFSSRETHHTSHLPKRVVNFALCFVNDASFHSMCCFMAALIGCTKTTDTGAYSFVHRILKCFPPLLLT